MRRILSLLILCFAVQTLNAASLNFLVLSDIHFDPFVGCSARPCPLIVKLRQQPVSAWSQTLNQFESKPSHLLQDTNGLLLEKSLTIAKKKAEEIKPQFVLVLGDSLGHEFYKKFKRFSDDGSRGAAQAFLYKTFAYLTQQLNSSFSALNIYVLVGNNDAYLGDYFTVPQSAFFQDAGRLWSSLIRNPAAQTSMQRQFDYAGYYALNFPQDNKARLIMLNSNVFSFKAKGKRAQEVAQRELDWLHAQLIDAKKNNQRVLIAMHIPDGIDAYLTQRTKLFHLYTLWKPVYVQRFQTEMQNFGGDVAGILSGHLHRAYLHRPTYGEHEILWAGVSAISPIFAGGTGFQVFAYTDNPLQITAYETVSTK